MGPLKQQKKCKSGFQAVYSPVSYFELSASVNMLTYKRNANMLLFIEAALLSRRQDTDSNGKLHI